MRTRSSKDCSSGSEGDTGDRQSADLAIDIERQRGSASNENGQSLRRKIEGDDRACPDGNALTPSAEVSGRTGARLALKVERETPVTLSAGKTSDTRTKAAWMTLGGFPLIRDKWQSAFAIELAFDVVATVANRLDRILHIVF